MALIATGETVSSPKGRPEAGRNRVFATVISMHTIKPLDYELLHVCGQRLPIITVEEHSVFGGLGEACASFLMQNGFIIGSGLWAFPMNTPLPVRRSGLLITTACPKPESRQSTDIIKYSLDV